MQWQMALSRSCCPFFLSSSELHHYHYYYKQPISAKDKLILYPRPNSLLNLALMALRAIRPPLRCSFSCPRPIAFISRSLSSPIDASISSNQLAHQLLDLFCKPPTLRDPHELRELGRRLNPETVEAVLRDVKEWRTAHEFFRWASWQDGFRHNCYTYNAMASVLSRARQRSHLRALVKELVARQCPMSPGALGFLIRCLGHQRLVDEAEYVFERAGDLNCVPNSYTYNCLLEVLAKVGWVESVELRFREMVENSRREPDKYTLTSVLQCYCNAGKLENVLDVFNRINDRGWVDEHVFTVLIVSFCKWGKIDQACEMVRQMESMGMKLSEKTFFVLIHGFVRQRRVDKSLMMFEKMKSYGFRGDLPLLSVLIDGLCEEKELGRAMNLYLEMKKRGISPDVRVVKKLISAFCSEGDLVTANGLLEEDGEKLDLGSLVLLYNAVLDGLVKHDEVKRAHMLLRAMMDSRTSQLRVYESEEDTLFRIKRAIRPNAESFSTVICGLCKTKELDKALVLLNDMIGMGCKGELLMYNDLISGLCDVDRLNESYELLRTMKDIGFIPTEFTYNSIFYCLCKKGDLAAALELLKEMRSQGHVLWIKHCTMMVQGLCQNRKVMEASGFLDDMDRLGFLPDMIPYSVVIDGICKTGDVDKALELFRHLSSSCYMFDVVAHNILINGFCKVGRLQEAKGVFNEMLEKGLVPSVVTYNLMIDGWCKAGKIDEAVTCFTAMVSDQRQPTVVSFTSLMDGLFNVGRVEGALRIWNEMREKGYAPNMISYTALVHGLCKCGKVDSAIFYFHEMKNCGYEPDTFIYLLLIDSLILNQNPFKALELLKEVVKKGDLPISGPKNLRLLRKVACNLYEDASTCLHVKLLVERGCLPMIAHDNM